MLGNTPLVAVALLLAAQVFVFLVGVRVRRAVASTGGSAVENPEEYVDGDAVECPECGTTNERGYRFCAECLGELPGAMTFESGSPVPFPRNIR